MQIADVVAHQQIVSKRIHKQLSHVDLFTYNKEKKITVVYAIFQCFSIFPVLSAFDEGPDSHSLYSTFAIRAVLRYLFFES